MSAYIITTTVGESSRSKIWDPSRPLPIGHPFQWVMEKTEKGIRIRNLAGMPGKLGSQLAQEIPDSELERGASIELPALRETRLKLRIKQLAPMEPVFRSSPPVDSTTELSVFTCWGKWVAESAQVRGEFKATLQKRPVFTLRIQREHCTLVAQAEGLVLQNSEKTLLGKGQAIQISVQELTRSSISPGEGTSLTWRFASLSSPAFPALEGGKSRAHRDEQTALFKKSLGASILGLSCLIAVAWIWPRPENNPEILIPPQVAKLVLKSQAQAESPAAARQESAQALPEKQPEKQPETRSDTAKKIQHSAVVQAFRAKALQSAVSGLLKGGMTQLLAQSDFVTGASASKEARSVLSARSLALGATGAETALTSAKNVKVAALGGEGGGTGKAGYGTGEHAAVKGQGHSFVSMDVASSTVEEGLTKDEVGEVIHRHLSEIRYCYESAMVRQPDIEGKLIVDFTIGGSGAVKSSEVKSSTLPDPRLDDCIIRRLVTWKFPNTKGKVDVAVSYPFIFKTLGR